jgi:hypothetical protein
MATAWQTFPIEFKGGLISNLSSLQQGVNAVGSASTLQNFEPSKEGGYKKILGYDKYDSTVVPGSGVITGVKVINVGEVLAIRANGGVSKVYHSTGSGWTLKATAALNGAKARFVDYKYTGIAKTLIVDGVNFPAIFEDVTNTIAYMTAPAEVQGAQHVAVYKGTAFFSKGSVLYFTAPLTDTDFSATNGGGLINVGHDVTGLVVFRDQLIIFSTNKIQRLTGTTSADFQLSPITDSIGCLDSGTIQEVGGDIMYLAPDGLRLLSATDRIGDFGLQIASSPITKDANTFSNSSTNFASIVLREKAQYRIFAYNASEQDQLAKGLLATKFSDQGADSMAWANLVGFKVYACDSKYTESIETILFANEDGYVYQMEQGASFDGEPIQAIYESPYMPISDPQIRKTFYKLTTYLEPKGNVSLDLNIKYDFGRIRGFDVIQPDTDTVETTGTSVSFYGSATYGTSLYGGQLDTVYTNQVIGSGKTIALRYEDNSTNPSFSLDTAILEFTQNDRQ